ncbi:uncharacterized protein F5891DRAFT_1217349 [Suillus fuscotomentosus]|uniref:N-acetyltransferase domain-containing protein n=1 Tax=Suillus fuscotomentosus TaxID=1912939 RepID=A0AAD4E9I5_9AGAM|nr:uncharacterized protein F5891DRAFT_1217349 [Suillus fuscotomentosus]KAG1902077.1 hypothetical protein F5891DRAFT_1217349 [Suillus fuscotomentosus]
MPGLNSSVRRFDRTNIPEDVWGALRDRDNAARANVILPHAEKVSSHQEFLPGSEQLWLVYSEPATSDIRFILSCTEGPLGKYPIFIIPVAPIQLASELLQGPMEAFCEPLLNEADFRRQRVFSVFSVEPVSRAFASAWEKIAEIKCINEPYYDAFFSACTPETFVRDGSQPVDEVIELRLAVPQDAKKIRDLCQEFSETSKPFTLSSEQASKEARLMIQNEQVWVYEIKEGDEETDIASIVAATRQSHTVAAITKVYTPEKWQHKGRAERLVRRVCRELLKTHEQVVLYVGANLTSAQRLYDRVGFQATSGPERWLEIGFDRAEVDLGHW